MPVFYVGAGDPNSSLHLKGKYHTLWAIFQSKSIFLKKRVYMCVCGGGRNCDYYMDFKVREQTKQLVHASHLGSGHWILFLKLVASTHQWAILPASAKIIF